MIGYPRAPEKRQERRHTVVDQALRPHVSPKCRAGQHSDQETGCGNTGASCLCECHDPGEY